MINSVLRRHPVRTGKRQRTIFERPAEEDKMKNIKNAVALLLILLIVYMCNFCLVTAIGNNLCDAKMEYLVIEKTNGYFAPLGAPSEKFGELAPGRILRTTSRYFNTDVEVSICRRDILWRKWVRVQWGGSSTGAAWVPASALEPVK